MFIPLSKRFFRESEPMKKFSVHDNGNNCNVRQQCLSSSSSSSSRNTRKIKKLYHVNLSSSQDKYPLSVSALPTHANDSDTLFHDDVFFDLAPSKIEIDDVFSGPVPSQIEIQNAFTSLQQVFGSDSLTQHVGNTCYYNLDSEVSLANTFLVDQVSSNGSETDWKEPPLSSHNPKNLLANGYDNVAFAIHLLQTDEHVQRMVKSLSSDKSIWHAVLNNEGVRELKNRITSERDRSSNGMINNDSSNIRNVMTLVSDAIKAKLMEAIKKIMKIVNKLFASAQHSKVTDATKSNLFKKKLNISVMLSIMIFLIVVVGRIYQSNSLNEKLRTSVYARHQIIQQSD